MKADEGFGKLIKKSKSEKCKGVVLLLRVCEGFVVVFKGECTKFRESDS